MVADVLVELSLGGINKTFSYFIPKELEKNIQCGKRVLVPFGNKKLEGFVIKIKEYEKLDYELKNIISIIDEDVILNEELLELGKYISNKTFSSLIRSYQTMLPVGLKAKSGKKINKKYISYIVIDNISNNIFKGKQLEIVNLLKKDKKVLKSDLTKISVSSLNTLIKNGVVKEVKEEDYRLNESYSNSYKDVVLTDKQQNIVDTVLNDKDKFSPFLLHGVTGSGKTEVYIKIIDKIIKEKKEAIVLVPEISLTPQLTEKFKNKFGNTVAVLHSGLSDGEKYDEWRKVCRKEVSIVIGARSAIFAPFENLGVIIIDEEHSDTYKQENVPKYNAIDVAIARSKYHKCPILLGSATPSIESYTRSKVGVYKLLELNERVGAKLPKVTLVDMKDEIKQGNKLFSSLLIEKIKEKLKNKEQIIILLNRRGYSTTISCHNCGYKVTCPKCDIPLTYHKKGNYLLCHYCNYKTYKPNVCPDCNSKDINEFGFGTEKLEEEIKKIFLDSKVIRMDVDTTSKKGSHKKIIDDFKNKKYDILVGTQMISKGLDFENVTLVGVINADASLNVPDFRSAERTFDLLSQVAGRAGRGVLNGEVIIQGFNTNHYSILTSSMHDYKSFYNEEMKIRRQLNYPPYYNLCLIKTKSINEDILDKENNKIVSYLRDNLNEAIVLGPSPCTIPKINNTYYTQILIKYKKIEEISKQLKFISEQYINKKIKLEIDINPYHI